MRSELFDPMTLSELPLRRLRSYTPELPGYSVVVLNRDVQFGAVLIGWGNTGQQAWISANRPKQWAAYTCYPFTRFDYSTKGQLRARVLTKDEPNDWDSHYLFHGIGRSRSG
jgi:hypothetical protein